MKTIILVTKGDDIEVFSKLTTACKFYNGLKYSYLKGLKFPFISQGYKFQKLKLITK